MSSYYTGLKDSATSHTPDLSGYASSIYNNFSSYPSYLPTSESLKAQAQYLADSVSSVFDKGGLKAAEGLQALKYNPKAVAAGVATGVAATALYYAYQKRKAKQRMEIEQETDTKEKEAKEVALENETKNVEGPGGILEQISKEGLTPYTVKAIQDVGVVVRELDKNTTVKKTRKTTKKAKRSTKKKTPKRKRTTNKKKTLGNTRRSTRRKH